jgi:hypothetical protein
VDLTGLDAPQGGVEATLGDQLVVGTGLDDPARLEVDTNAAVNLADVLAFVRRWAP